MRLTEQGLARGGYAVQVRTLTFLTRGDRVLLLRGAAGRTFGAGRLNGVGGRLEVGESALSAARREVLEETGLAVGALDLRAVVHVDGADGAGPGALLLVYVGQVPAGQPTPSAEGTLEWHPIGALPLGDLVEDLPDLLPRVLAPAEGRRIVYGHYAAGPDGVLSFRFEPA